MGLMLAFKAFLKAFQDPKKAEDFVLGKQPPQLAAQSGDFSHLRLLSLLQQSGRLVDFLKEDISAFSDAEVGAAARQVHRDCAKLIEELVTVRPVMEEGEGSNIRVPVGYDPATIRLVGQVKGQPPFEGVLVHKGWKAHKRSLPKGVGDQKSEVICPAEVEVRGSASG